MRKTTVGVVIILFLVIAFFSNNFSLQSTVDSCIKANGEAKIEKDFLGMNWNVKCELE
ncbi:hypothetical protein [Alkalihalobacillus sp. CinArs1]|uniref:hypothetical protein n=1 Tax=Alkalihalobacillus sp. CinArs1 TaxID=2995314 RepID=UPI0022DDCC26|nr:hypothetical protein [Alkalihalobacillus sp. CinArs1]